MELRVIEIVMGLITLVSGGGWWVSWRNNKKLEHLKVYGEQFDLFKKSLDFAEERMRLYEERILHLESANFDLKKKFLELQNQIFEKKVVSE